MWVHQAPYGLWNANLIKMCSQWPTTTLILVKNAFPVPSVSVSGDCPLVAQWEHTHSKIWPLGVQHFCPRHLHHVAKLGIECGGSDWLNVIFLNCTTFLHWTRKLPLHVRTRTHRIRFYLYWPWCAFHRVNITKTVGWTFNEQYCSLVPCCGYCKCLFYTNLLILKSKTEIRWKAYHFLLCRHMPLNIHIQYYEIPWPQIC